jgi:hypothetical protein
VKLGGEKRKIHAKRTRVEAAAGMMEKILDAWCRTVGKIETACEALSSD